MSVHCAFLEELHQFTEACRQDAKLSQCTFITRRGGRIHITLRSFLPMQFGQLQTVGQALRTEALKLMSQLDTTTSAAATAATDTARVSSNGGGSNGGSSNGTNGKEVRTGWHIDPTKLR
jgi:hypothetical protein